MNSSKKSSILIGKLFWLSVYFLSPIIPILFIYNSNTIKFNDTRNFIAMVTGTLAFVWLVYEFVLSSKPKIIEKYFGLDKFYIFHGLMAFIAVFLIFIHQAIVEGGGGGNLKFYGSVSFYIFIGVVILASIFVASTILLKIKLIEKLRTTFSKFKLFKYNGQVLVHNIVLVAYILMFLHVLQTPALKNHSATKLVFSIYFALGLFCYIYHTFIKKFWLSRHLFIVKDVIKESDTMWSLNLAPEKGKIFGYKPGQFGYIKIYSETINAEQHPFSISSSPLNKEYISFTIKELGDFTKEIGKVRIGDKVRVDAPYGRFSYTNYSDEKTTVLIAGGVGITPNLSMIRYMTEWDKDREVILIWGINNTAALICSDDFKIAEASMKNFHFVPVMFKDDSWNGEKGLVNRAKIEKILGDYKVDISSSGFYICGPPILMNTVVPNLKEMGVKKSNIHFEKFSL